MKNPNELLKNLVDALDSAFISTWQTTADWDKQLNEAREYVDSLNEKTND